MKVESTSSPWVTYYSPSKVYSGYTLFAPKGGTVVWLIDMQGCFVHCWEMSHLPGEYGVLLPNGNLLYGGKVIPGPMNKHGGFGGVLIEVDWDGNIVWQYDDVYLHHDFHRMDNGNTMTLRWVTVPHHIALRVKGGISDSEEEVMWTDALREITPDGKVVWEWLGYEHLDPVVDTICPLSSRREWTHANACFVLPDGNILTTFRETNTVAIIDKDSGAIKWRWGAGELAHPHNPTLLDNGNILIFDNGSHRPKNSREYSRVLEVNPETDKIEWEYKADPPRHFYASFISGCQRLPNGNTLICGGPMGRIFEVTPDKEIVWEYNNPFYFKDVLELDFGWNNAVFRAYRYSLDYPALKGKQLDPDSVELTLRARPQVKEKAVRDRLGALGY